MEEREEEEMQGDHLEGRLLREPEGGAGHQGWSRRQIGGRHVHPDPPEGAEEEVQ